MRERSEIDRLGDATVFAAAGTSGPVCALHCNALPDLAALPAATRDLV